mgnify:CR=1 FL=1
MKKKFFSFLLALVLVLVPIAATGCGGDSDNATGKIRFWAYGDQTVKDAMTAMVEKYNSGQGKKDGVTVSYSHKIEDSYISLIEQNATSKNGPDVYYAWDRLFKKWTAADMTVNLTDYVNAAVADGSLNLDTIWKSTVSRFRYNKELNMSGDTESIYGLPVDTSPTVLYYNRTALRARGVTVISVAAEDMAKWNAGEIGDKYGLKKSDVAELKDINVPAKGFFRNDNGTRKTEQGGTSWQEPAPGTVMVFNEQIAMNWDEIEDIGFLMTNKKNNVKPTTEFGYFTEWWFNYGWSVGGDCVVDLSGNGSWAYSHGDWSENYIVNEGKTFKGHITGKTYQAGETLDFLDKIQCEVNDDIKPDNKGAYTVNGVALGAAGEITNDSATRDSVKAAVADGTLTPLPSIREAFTRFACLAGTGSSGLAICPYPSAFSTTTSIQYFTGGKVAFIVERGFQLPIVDEYVGNNFEWAVAPLPVYKEYTEPSADLKAQYADKADAYNTEVAREGKIAGHSESTALVIREKSTMKEQAWKFIRWMVGEEAQAVKASYGFIPNQESQIQGFYDKLDAKNTKNLNTFVNAAKYETPGDWWYMIDRDWIDVWANPLNSQVRYGKMTLEEYFNTYIERGNSTVKTYGNWDNGLDKVKNYNA